MLVSMTLRFPAVLAAALLVLAACSSDDQAEDPDPTQGDSSRLVEVSPLTGQEFPEGAPDNPVFVVKIENTRAGAPQIGLPQADLVVQQLVEGGVTRLAALYHSNLPETLGHIRSMRATDASIAAPVAGQIVASGGAPPTYDVVAAAGVIAHTEDHDAPGFSGDPAKSRPYNRLVDLSALAASAPAAEIPGPYLEWTPADADSEDGADSEAEGEAAEGEVAQGEAAESEPRQVSTAAVRFSPSTTATWAFQDGAWQRTNGFAPPGEDFLADTLIVIFAPLRDAGYLDPSGSPVPETVFEGSGQGAILSGGTYLDVTWSKEDRASTLTFADAAGNPVTIDPGKVWIELGSEDSSVTAE